MSVLHCRACGADQPANSRPDESCFQCGTPLRDEVRCPWCTVWTPAGGHCRKCGCKLVPPERFGAARMLVRKGVDQLSLADRVASLEPGLLETLSAQFAAQLAVLAIRVDELRFCESFLLSRGHAARFEEGVLPGLPLSQESLDELRKGPQGPFDGREERLGAIFDADERYSPARTLAAIALLRRGQAPKGVIEEVESALYTPELEFDAAVALACWRARPHVWSTRYSGQRLREVAEKELSSERLGPWAAVVLSRFRSRAPADPIAERLREGLSSADPELRFECALALKDEESLAAAFDSDDPVKATLARRALAETGHAKVARAIVEGPDEVRRQVLPGLAHPISAEVATALATALPSVAEAERDQIVSFMRHEPFAQMDAAVRAEWHRWALAGGRGVTPEQAFDLLEWATSRPGEPSWPPGSGEEIGAFVEVAAEAFRTAGREMRAKLARDSAFARLLVLAGESRLPLFVETTLDPELGPELLEKLFWAHAVSQRDDLDDTRAADVLFRIWDAAGERRAELVAPFAEQARSHRGISGRELLLERIWSRLRSAEVAERAWLAAAFEAWRDELGPLYDADPDLPKDPVERFRFWAQALPKAIWSLVSEVWDRVPRERTGAFVEAVFDAAERIVATHPRTAVAAASRAAAALVNTYREDPAPELDGWVQALAARFSAFEPRFLAARPESDSESGAENLLEDIRVELRLAAEARERREESERWAREQERRRVEQAERARREEERRRLEWEQQQRQEAQRQQAQREASARDSDLAARIADAVAKAVPPKQPSGPLSPTIPLEPIDSEPLLPGTPLPTLLDYVRFMKQMSAGADVMQLFSAHGLTAQSWPLIVNGWSAILTGRMDLGMRFGALMAAPWA